MKNIYLIEYCSSHYLKCLVLTMFHKHRLHQGDTNQINEFLYPFGGHRIFVLSSTLEFPLILFYTTLQQNLFSYSTPNLQCSCHMLPNSSCSALLDTFLRPAMNVSTYDKSGITLISRSRQNPSRILKITSDIICPQWIAELINQELHNSRVNEFPHNLTKRFPYNGCRG